MDKLLKYFNNNELAATVFKDKYATRDGKETPSELFDRLTDEFFRIESSKFKKPLSREEIRELFADFKGVIGGGSVMFGVGNTEQIVSLSNCFVVESPLDSYSSIIKTDGQLVNISKRRGGVGVCLDNLRPKGALTKNAAKSSSGIVPFMKRFSNTINEVGQEGRRGAEMQLISVHHPEILNFINAKMEEGAISGANISVKLTDEFLTAVMNYSDYEQRFPVDPAQERKISVMVSAKKVWEAVIRAAWKRAEPGILFWDNITSNGPADIYERFRSQATNPCSELPLCQLDSCRLMALNLFSFVKNPFAAYAQYDYDALYNAAYKAQRLMDALVDLESESIQKILNKIKSDPEPEDIKRDEYLMWQKIKANNDEGRRCGLGFLALADVFAALNLQYGSSESLIVAEEIAKTIKLGAYRSSVDMAKELGSFVGFDAEKEKEHPFFIRMKEEDPKLFEDMMKYGRRNIAITTVAPTGSISILAETTSGIEPVFELAYTRRKKIQDDSQANFTDKEGVKWKEYQVFHPKLALWMEVTGKTNIEESPYFNSTANKIDWINRVKLQGVIQKHICSSISSTVNLPKTVSEETVSEIYNAAWKEKLKGITVYRDGCRSGVLVKDPQNNDISAIKRPKELACDIYHISVTKKLDKLRTFSYLVALGLLNNKPYEIFCVENGKYDKSITAGKIVRHKQGHYDIILSNGDVIENITKDTTDEEDSLTRLVSLNLRHNVPINYIVDQLVKVKGEMFCFAKSISRSLKKYVKDGTHSTENCTECGTKLIFENGCCICKNCGHSKC